ncbi:MAG: methyl-accepting chemotaxis protein [Candidatus Devosia phytovorans]|uniref:Methyl-accepting chemotaxis protein n=1 Tax=Candidatus Devosia phytovorans TaxID=3121372 RepID=A0AAJ5VW15_9HYPH|nr:methyl-accepting chemotaxis protein [Devosia sp.]WEK05215.1 MAG: methyl-accepting chemotaxis protein [Devosia sp.]
MRFSPGIKAKLFSILALTCFVSLAGLGFLATRYQDTGERYARFVDTDSSAAILSVRFAAGMWTANAWATRMMMLDPASQEYQTFKEGIASNYAGASERLAQAAVLVPERKAALDDLAAQMRGVQDGYNRAITAYEAGNMAGMQAAMAEVDALLPVVSAAAGANNTAFAERIANGNATLTEHTNQTIVSTLAILCSVVLLLTGLAAYIVHSSVTRRISRITAVMDQLTAGHYDVDVPYQANRDEIGAMSRSVEVFRENGMRISQMTEADAARIVADEEQRRAMMSALQAAFGEVVDAAVAGDFSKRVHAEFPDAELNSLGSSVNALVETVDKGLSETGTILEALSRTDLTVRMQGDYRGAFAKLKNDANGVADTLSQVVTQLKQTSRSIKTATGEILSGANDLSERTTKQAATIEETSAAMEQLAATVLQNADRARDANNNAQSVSRIAEEGGEVMGKTTVAMERISASSAKISNIIGLIDDIAFQTNLLALNASVEAARAGDAGKGFAVVAVEVRRLAQSAAQASSEVKALIDASAGEVAAGTKLVNEASTKLENVLTSIKANSALMDGIARDSREQASAIDEVTVAVRQMDEMTQHNAALVEETNAAIEQTESQASELDRVIDVFVVSGAGSLRAAASAPSRAPAPVAMPARTATARNYLSQGNAAISSDWDEF